ncbi:Uncharacterized conserved protein [Variovorax sp. 770b2]|nr:saccharopine dehydrogenase NADP-binding domain-containing protein [Variovorax sp. 770b2]SFQ05499.1 Uncharacterized conserved protein [Variovorax sp. 770b2]
MTSNRFSSRGGAREFDIVLYGATGFTGRLVAECFLNLTRAGEPLRWAMAGRNMRKLEEVHSLIGASPSVPLIAADATSGSSLEAMALRSRVVVTTVGPYQFYGTELVQACVRTGTDYIDLCGELGWMREIIDTHHEEARVSGARIVFSGGFDSVPFDCGVQQLQKHHVEQFGHPAQRVRGRVMAMKGEYSGGTVASLKASLEATAVKPGLRALLGDPFALTPGFRGIKQPDGETPYFDETIDAWVAPFVMAPINTKNIHRTNYLLGHPYGSDFQYDEMLVMGSGDVGKKAAQRLGGGKAYELGSQAKPGEGPNLASRRGGFYDILFAGRTATGEVLRLVVTGDQDPGYGSTSKMLSQAALCLTEDDQSAGGIWTPAALMGDALVDRLQTNAGVNFALFT